MVWRKTGIALAALPIGTVREVMIGSSAVLLARTSEGIYAVDAVCPHLGGLLGDGTLTGRRLACPDHRAVFDITTGSVVADPFGIEPPPGIVAPLGAYPTRVATELIEVDVPAL